MNELEPNEEKWKEETSMREMMRKEMIKTSKEKMKKADDDEKWDKEE
jgi:hypothetical protein